MEVYPIFFCFSVEHYSEKNIDDDLATVVEKHVLVYNWKKRAIFMCWAPINIIFMARSIVKMLFLHQIEKISGGFQRAI